MLKLRREEWQSRKGEIVIRREKMRTGEGGSRAPKKLQSSIKYDDKRKCSRSRDVCEENRK